MLNEQCFLFSLADNGENLLILVVMGCANTNGNSKLASISMKEDNLHTFLGPLHVLLVIYMFYEAFKHIFMNKYVWTYIAITL